MNLVEEYSCINNDTEIEYRYTYRLIKKDFNGVAAYGIEIERKDYINLKNVNLERDRIDKISVDRHNVKQILMKLYDNQVSPIHLLDIVGAYADEHTYEFDVGVQKYNINWWSYSN